MSSVNEIKFFELSMHTCIYITCTLEPSCGKREDTYVITQKQGMSSLTELRENTFTSQMNVFRKCSYPSLLRTCSGTALVIQASSHLNHCTQKTINNHNGRVIPSRSDLVSHNRWAGTNLILLLSNVASVVPVEKRSAVVDHCK